MIRFFLKSVGVPGRYRSDIYPYPCSFTVTSLELDGKLDMIKNHVYSGMILGSRSWDAHFRIVLIGNLS